MRDMKVQSADGTTHVMFREDDGVVRIQARGEGYVARRTIGGVSVDGGGSAATVELVLSAQEARELGQFLTAVQQP